MADAHPFAPLAGTWRGKGSGSYPTIADFAYREELVVEPVPGRPVAFWRSSTRDAATGEPRHGETGFLRATPAGIEFVAAHGPGLVERSAGTFDGTMLRLQSTSVDGTATAKEVGRIDRRYELTAGGELRYEVAMAAVGVGLTDHLAATLTRA